ncbi:sigma 54-interacting transcriptional regulator, partial [Klebsiella pneumoniae]|nr:sigma 54-interacting transcriptional regulator [Klebsiella pneumoniae]
MESELFGHKKGSFTGATQDKQGLILSAHGGSLFLDEIAELPLSMQVKLLRAVQEKKIRPVGSDQEIDVDFRVISASHQDLDLLVRQGKFRQDLFFRIHVMDLILPPLRERGEDVLLLANHFIQKICME